ncbi:MAG: hypothetical protein R3B70_09690 [Polyangiaceae bacterium]
MSARRRRAVVVRLVLALAGLPSCGGPPVYSETPPCQGDPDPERTACEDLAMRLSVACGGDSARTQVIQREARLCGTERAPVLRRGLECLLAHSQERCSTFSDPGEAEACLPSMAADFDVYRAEDLARRVSQLCGGGETKARSLLVHTEPPLAALSEVTLDSLSSCVDQATTCAGASRCLGAPFKDTPLQAEPALLNTAPAPEPGPGGWEVGKEAPDLSTAPDLESTGARTAPDQGPAGQITGSGEPGGALADCQKSSS